MIIVIINEPCSSLNRAFMTHPAHYTLVEVSVHSNRIFNTLINWRNFRLKLFVQGIVVGILASTLVVLFRFILEKSDLWLQHLYSVLRSGSPWLLLIWGMALIFIAYLIGTIVQKQPLISGSGIPQVKGAVSGHLEMNWFSTILWKFIGGILAIGAGLSLGREGPSIQLGAAAGQGVNRLFGGLKIEERILITSGASCRFGCGLQCSPGRSNIWSGGVAQKFFSTGL